MKRLLVALALLSLIAITLVSADHPFSSSAGFSKAKMTPRQSITVQNMTGWRLDVNSIIAPWNTLAGWPLFTVVTANGDVQFVASGSTWVRAEPSYTEPFTRCIIYTSTIDVPTLQHEIGHCLGFGDHIQAVYYGTGNWINPKVCDDPNHPAYSPYRGVESYCTPYTWQWWGTDDLEMLRDAGYMPPIPTPTPTQTPLYRR